MAKAAVPTNMTTTAALGSSSSACPTVVTHTPTPRSRTGLLFASDAPNDGFAVSFVHTKVATVCGPPARVEIQNARHLPAILVRVITVSARGCIHRAHRDVVTTTGCCPRRATTRETVARHQLPSWRPTTATTRYTFSGVSHLVYRAPPPGYTVVCTRQGAAGGGSGKWTSATSRKLHACTQLRG